MAKSAGFLKKLKKIGDIIGKGASWVNKNIVKPLNPIIDTALDFVPGGSTIKTVKNFASKGLDYLDDNYYNTEEDDTVQQYVKTGADVLLDTQRSKKDQKYLKYGGMDINKRPFAGIPNPLNNPLRKLIEPNYINPFGAPIN